MTAMDLYKILNFYGRFTPSYTKIGYIARGLFIKRYPTDYSGQRWLVTGASGGIGKAIMHAAAKGGAEVVAVARSEEKLTSAIAELRPDAAARVSYEVVDMSLQQDTQVLADRLAAAGTRFDVLINNVGILLNAHTMTTEGRETTFVTNLLSHYLLTEHMVEHELFADSATVVNMTSGGMYNSPVTIKGLNVTDPAKYAGKAVYGAQKRGQAVLTGYWNKQYGDRGLKVYVTHPGWAKTMGVKQALPTFWKIQNILLRSPFQGGETALWLVSTQPPTSEDHDAGVWFDHKLRPAHIFPFSQKPRCTVDELVAYLDEELAKGRASETAAA